MYSTRRERETKRIAKILNGLAKYEYIGDWRVFSSNSNSTEKVSLEAFYKMLNRFKKKK